MREEWIERLYREGFVPVKDANSQIWDCAFTEAAKKAPDILVRMLWTPVEDAEDNWTLEWIWASTGTCLATLSDYTFDYIMTDLQEGPMNVKRIVDRVDGYLEGRGLTRPVSYLRNLHGVSAGPTIVKEPDKDAHRCVWDLAKNRLLIEGWNDTGCPNLEYSSAYCGLGYTIRATMQDDGRFSVCLWGDPGEALGSINLTLDDVSAMGKKTLYELLPAYVEKCAEQLRKRVGAKKCADEYFRIGEPCHILPPGVPDKWLDKLREMGFTIGSAKVTAYKNVNMLNGKAYKVSVTLMGSVVHVEIADAYQAAPVVAFGVNSDSLDRALTKATEWLLKQSREV